MRGSSRSSLKNDDVRLCNAIPVRGLFPNIFQARSRYSSEEALLITAQFVRIVTTDRPEFVRFIAANGPGYLREFSISAVKHQIKASEKDETLVLSLSLVLGGTPFKGVTYSRYPH